MPSLQYTLSVEQLHVVSRAAREIKIHFAHPIDGLAALSLLLIESTPTTRADRLTGHFGAPPAATITSATAPEGSSPAPRVHPSGTFWSRADGFLASDPPPPPTHFVAHGMREDGTVGPLACVGLTKFPDGITYSDEWTPNAVLRVFSRIHGDIWDDINRISVEPSSRSCFCAWVP